MSTISCVLPWEKSYRDIHVIVIGDLMLDEYLDGEVNRISPEAPVPVHLVQKTTLSAGGAANVARNIRLVGGLPHLCSVWGNDDAARQLQNILRLDSINTELMITDEDRPTVKKTRVTSNHNQLVRIDWEKAVPVPQNLQDEIYKRVISIKSNAILLSDYGKGCLTKGFLEKIISFANKKNIPVVVDPKGRDYSGYKGAYLITPNRKEACEALGLDPSDNWSEEELGRGLQEKYDLGNVLLTLGQKGMYFQPEPASAEKPVHLAAISRDVFDVSGAGDTVIAIATLAIGSGLAIGEAMKLANIAAGRVVEKWGTQPIYRDELVQAIQEANLSSRNNGYSTERKIVSREELKNLIGEVRGRHKQVVFTNGCFDILHAGHISYLEEAATKGDLLVVAINTDESVRKLKGKSRPIIPCEQRLRLMAALAAVDFVVSFDEETPAELIEYLRPNVLIKGADYKTDEIVGAKTVLELGGKVETIDLVEGLSTSFILGRIKDRL